MEIYEQIKEALDIADIIGERGKLRSSSRGYTGLCPFHEERTPSFHVYTDTQSYYCFGCHAAGDVFTFLMQCDNLSFSEVLKELAERAGVELPRSYEKNILELAEKFYRENMTEAARAYLARRQITDADIEKFSLGYSPNSWDALVVYLRKKGYSDKQMLESGLAVRGKYGVYDRFRGRVMFPIKDSAGRVIAFGGRLIDGEGAKYVNSANYDKGKSLYLINEARRVIREKKRSILVEGYMDAIRLHKSGFIETVATMGTSLTDEQAKMISRLADKCYICYDSDRAGQQAIMRGMYILAENGLDVRVVSLPECKDPDEFLSLHKGEEFEKILEEAKPLIQYHIEHPSKDMFEMFVKLDIGEVLRYKPQLSRLSGMPPSWIEEWFISRQMPEKSVKPFSAADVESPYEAAFCSMIFRHMWCAYDALERGELLQNPDARNAAYHLLNECQDYFMSSGEPERVALIVRGDEFCTHMEEKTEKEKWERICKELKKAQIKRRLEELMGKLRRSEATPEELKELTELKRSIS